MQRAVRPPRRRRRELQRLADGDLMGLIADFDPDAFAVIYDRHCETAFSLAHSLCGERSSAEAVLHEAFMSLWRGAGVRDHGSVRDRVLAIVHGRAIEALRRDGALDDLSGFESAAGEKAQEWPATALRGRVMGDVRREAQVAHALRREGRRRGRLEALLRRFK